MNRRDFLKVVAVAPVIAKEGISAFAAVAPEAATETRYLMSFFATYETASSQKYVLDFGGDKLTLWRMVGSTKDAPENWMVDGEYDTPFSDGDLPGLKFIQNGNSVVIASKNHAPMALREVGAGDWLNYYPGNFELVPVGVGGGA